MFYQPGFLYMLAKALKTGPSRAQAHHNTATDFGSPADRVQEWFRRCVRELFTFWIFGTVILMFYFSLHNGQPDDQNVYRGAFFTTLYFFPAWALYRLIRFALIR